MSFVRQSTANTRRHLSRFQWKFTHLLTQAIFSIACIKSKSKSLIRLEVIRACRILCTKTMCNIAVQLKVAASIGRVQPNVYNPIQTSAKFRSAHWRVSAWLFHFPPKRIEFVNFNRFRSFTEAGVAPCHVFQCIVRESQFRRESKL